MSSYAQFHDVIKCVGKKYQDVFELSKTKNNILEKHYQDVVVKFGLDKDTVIYAEMIMDFKEDNEQFINSTLNYYTNKSDSIFYGIEVKEDMTYSDLVFVNEVSTMYIYQDTYFITLTINRDKFRPKLISMKYEIRQ